MIVKTISAFAGPLAPSSHVPNKSKIIILVIANMNVVGRTCVCGLAHYFSVSFSVYRALVLCSISIIADEDDGQLGK